MNKWNVLPLCLLASQAIADNKPAAPSGGYTGLGAESISPAEIAKFAPPLLDEKVSRRIQMMLDVRGGNGGLVTSKGDRMFFGTRITGTAQVWRQDGPMKFPIQLTGGEDRTSFAGLTPDEKTLIVSRDVGGQENPGLYAMPVEGGPLRLIQNLPKVQTELAYITDDSSALYFRSNDIAPDSYAIYKYDLKAGKRELVFSEKGLWSIEDHRGDSWLLAKALGNTQVEIYQYDLGTRKLTPLLGQGERELFDVAFGAKGEVLVHTDKVGEYQRIYRLEAGGKLVPITPELKFDVDRMRIDRQRTRIYYEVNENGYARTYALDAATYKPLALPKLPEADNVRFLSVSRNGRFAVLETNSATAPQQAVVFDWQTRKTTAWQVPSTPEVDLRSFAKESLEYYPARDGTKIPMFVRRPASCAGPCPVVVSFHGGPEGQSRSGFSPMAQLFVDAGFTYVEPNVRGSTGYGKTWFHADDGPKRLAIITDIEDCAKYIRASWGKGGQAPKIGVMGGSYGGYSTLIAMTMFAGAYDAGVSIVGISNLYSFLMNTAPYRRILRASEYGDPEKDKEALIQLSPITHIAKIKSPLMIIQGVNDPRVPVGEALQIYKQLESRKIPGGLILFPDEGHGAAKRGNIVQQTGQSIAFFEKHLLGKPAGR